VVAVDRANADARLATGSALVCALAFGVFVAWPQLSRTLLAPLGAGDVVLVGFVLTVVLGPVAAGLSASASFVALWRDGGALPTTARRLHLVTVVIAPVLLVLLLTLGAPELASVAD
jgi:hypothetical protein